MHQAYYLSTCDTCKKIKKSLPENAFHWRDIKVEPLNETELAQLREKAGSYEALFSRNSRLYKSMGLKDQKLSESDYKKYLLEHYTFLKRPVFVVGDRIFIGNRSETVEALKTALTQNAYF